jgi:hypothetical protein
MPIDDPFNVELTLAKNDLESQDYLPAQLLNLGISATTAAVFAKLPFVSQILVSLIPLSRVRFEERFIRMFEEMNNQYMRIATKVDHRSFYESEEFQTLLGLLLERLNTSHDSEKIKTFGRALANSGSKEFKHDPKEEYILIVRDLSAADLLELQRFAPEPPPKYQGKIDDNTLFNFRRPRKDFRGDELSRINRLVGIGVVIETLEVRDVKPSGDISTITGARREFAKFLQQPPMRSYTISEFGWRFLRFISSGGEAN